MLAPIALFVFARPLHTRLTVESLKLNNLARNSDLFIFSDAKKYDAQEELVCEIRQYIRQIEGFKSITIIERETNFGLSKSIIDGVTSLVNRYGRIIVLEDDLVTSTHFLTYMNEALEKYSNDDRIVSIHGYVYPCNKLLPEAFFLPGADCWGWGTWKRGWDLFNPDGRQLLDEINRRQLTATFDYNGAYPFSRMLEDQILGKNDSWAIRWHASAFLAGKLTLYPGRSLVNNIGHDNSGTHCGENAEFETAVSDKPIDLRGIKVKSSEKAMKAFERFLRGENTLQGQIVRKIATIKLSRKFIEFAKSRIPPEKYKKIRKRLFGS
jgi:hypothetical protein